MLLITVYTLLTYGVYITGYMLLSLFRAPFEPWRNRFMRVWSKGMARILNMHIKTEGDPPDPPFILISNHLSYIDIVPLYVNLDCTFVAKKEVKSWPVLGPMVKTTGVVFVDRTSRKDVVRVNDRLSKSLNEYQGMVMFPEGTTSGGKGVLPFRSSLLDYPASEKIPVCYSSISYRTDEKGGDSPADESVCFYGARDPFHSHLVKLVSNRRIDCTIRFGSSPVKSDNRKELAQKLHAGVMSIFLPTGRSGNAYPPPPKL